MRRSKAIMTQVELYLTSRAKQISPNYLRDSGTVLRAWATNALQDDLARLDLVDTQSIQNWLGSLTIKPATFAAYAFTLKQFFAWCVANGSMETNPAEHVEIPRHRKPFRKTFVSAATVATLINGCSDQELRYCLYCGFHAGLRFSEVVASRPEWFNLANRTLSVLRSDDYDTKDHTDRDVPLTDAFVQFLRG